jgi:hypothetical protein
LQVTGAVLCWGNNDRGQLGISNTQPRYVPDVVIGLSNAISISAGGAHSCAVLATGVADCWGDNTNGQLGAKDLVNPYLTATPVIENFVNVNGVSIPIPLQFVVSIAAGNSHTCSLSSYGRPLCWGLNTSGQIGDGTTTSPRLRPTIVNSFTANVDPAAVLDTKGRIATVTALINCPFGGEAHISLTLEQSGTTGTGMAVESCAGGLVRVPMTIAAQGRETFQTGPATANVEALVKDRGTVTEDQHWSRAVTLGPAQ